MWWRSGSSSRSACARSASAHAPDDQDGIAELQIVGEPATYEEMAALLGDFDASLLDEVSPTILMAFNDPSVRAVGVPGGGGIGTAADLAMYYQALLHDPDGLWDPEVLADATGHIRCTLPNPMTGVASNRSLGLIIAGDDGLGSVPRHGTDGVADDVRTQRSCGPDRLG